MDVPGAVETAGPVEVSPLCPDRGRDAGRDDVGFVGMCFPRPLLVVSSEASAQSRHPHEPVGCDRKRRLREDVSTDVPGAVETAGPLGVSPLRAAGALRSRRRWFAGGWLLLRDTPPPPALSRVERSAVTEGNEYSWGAQRSRDTPTTLPDATGNADSAKIFRWTCQEPSKPLVPWRSLHSVPTGVGTPVETTLVS